MAFQPLETWTEKRNTVEAVRWFPDKEIEYVRRGLGGKPYVTAYNAKHLYIERGDWILLNSLGHLSVMTDTDFREKFERTPLPDTV